jgi:RAC serine/threonine-protein kinase
MMTTIGWAFLALKTGHHVIPMAASIKKEGALLKKGEYIQTLRPRWFILKTDGSFRGYKQKPTDESELPVNVFEVQRSDITPINPKDPSSKEKGKYGFTIRFMQLTRVFERSFHLDTMEERDSW